MIFKPLGSCCAPFHQPAFDLAAPSSAGFSFSCRAQLNYNQSVRPNSSPSCLINTLLLIHLFKRYFFSNYQMPGPILGQRDEAYTLVGRRQIEKNILISTYVFAHTYTYTYLMYMYVYIYIQVHVVYIHTAMHCITIFPSMTAHIHDSGPHKISSIRAQVYSRLYHIVLCNYILRCSHNEVT